MNLQRAPRTAVAVVTVWGAAGCDPNPHGPAAPAAPPSSAAPGVVKPGGKPDTAPLRQVGPPADG